MKEIKHINAREKNQSSFIAAVVNHASADKKLTYTTTSQQAERLYSAASTLIRRYSIDDNGWGYKGL